MIRPQIHGVSLFQNRSILFSPHPFRLLVALRRARMAARCVRMYYANAEMKGHSLRAAS